MMIKKALIAVFPFLISACGESTDDKITNYCMTKLNKFSSVSLEECSCFKDFVKSNVPESDITEMLKAPPLNPSGPTLTKGESVFMMAAHNSKCFD